MVIVRIEHPVSNFDDWKRAFDSDPVGRRQAGVRRYRILRPVDDSRFVVVDLELDAEPQAVAMLAALRAMWKTVEGRIIFNPQTRILAVAESKELP